MVNATKVNLDLDCICTVSVCVGIGVIMLPIWMREIVQRVNMERRVRLASTIVSIIDNAGVDVTPEDIDIDDGLLDIIIDQNEPKFDATLLDDLADDDA